MHKYELYAKFLVSRSITPIILLYVTYFLLSIFYVLLFSFLLSVCLNHVFMF